MRDGCPLDNGSMRAGTVFITGICASGKSTLGKRLMEDLTRGGMDNVKLLDGENIRKELAGHGERYGYSTKERSRVALKIAQISLGYHRKGISCIVCAICHVKSIREEMRAIIGNVLEVYLDCSVSICAERDYKGYYARAFKGACDNFIGVTEPYQVSDNTELVLHTGRQTIDECAGILLEKAKDFFSVGEDRIYKA